MKTFQLTFVRENDNLELSILTSEVLIAFIKLNVGQIIPNVENLRSLVENTIKGIDPDFTFQIPDNIGKYITAFALLMQGYKGSYTFEIKEDGTISGTANGTYELNFVIVANLLNPTLEKEL